MLFSFHPFKLDAIAIPKAAEIEVEECPTPKASYSLSSFEENQLIPPIVYWYEKCLFFLLIFYVHMLDDQHPKLINQLGVSKT